MNDVEKNETLKWMLPQPREVKLSAGTAVVEGLKIDGIMPSFLSSGVVKLPGLIGSGVPLAFQVDSQLKPQAYRLSIQPHKIEIAAAGEVGLFHGAQTLRQILQDQPTELPCMVVEDSPDFPVRGVMLDISRDKVPTMATLLEFIDRLAGWKINQLQLYIEHTFAYSAHRTVWEKASPLTAEEIRQLDVYCKERFIELVPNQNSFGHMERWLKHPQYQHLAEAVDGAETPWGFRWKGPFSLCPTDPASLEFLKGLYAELLPNFSSRLFNVGCDETFDIGQGRSKEECDKRGITPVYLDFLKKVNTLVQAHGRRMLFWGDIIIHKPELLGDLPPGALALHWGYEADHPFDKELPRFAEAGVEFYICPGTSSWVSIGGRTTNALGNLSSAAELGLKYGATGYLNTDWGDYGHLQYLPISYLGFAAGAAFSWCFEKNKDTDWADALDRQIFGLGAGLGTALFDLGNVYLAFEKKSHNGSWLFRVLIPPPNDPTPEKALTAEELDAAEAAIAAAAKKITGNGLVQDELRNAVATLNLAVGVSRLLLQLGGDAEQLKKNRDEIVLEHRRLWLARNRPGGLEDSVQRLAAIRFS